MKIGEGNSDSNDSDGSNSTNDGNWDNDKDTCQRGKQNNHDGKDDDQNIDEEEDYNQKDGFHSMENAICDLCEESDGFRKRNLQKCRTCGVYVHEECYGLLNKTPYKKYESWECLACSEVGKTVEIITTNGDTKSIIQKARAMECAFCSVKTGIHAMHPLYTDQGTNIGKPLVLAKNKNKKIPERTAWVHTLCADFNAKLQGFCWGSKADNNTNSKTLQHEKDGSRKEERKEESTPLLKQSFHHYVLATKGNANKDTFEKRREFQTQLKCSICSNKDNAHDCLRIPVQCVAGDKNEHGEFKEYHAKLKKPCVYAFHIGCARWAAKQSVKRVFYYPEGWLIENKNHAIYCGSHAKNVSNRNSTKLTIKRQSSEKRKIIIEKSSHTKNDADPLLQRPSKKKRSSNFTKQIDTIIPPTKSSESSDVSIFSSDADIDTDESISNGIERNLPKKMITAVRKSEQDLTMISVDATLPTIPRKVKELIVKLEDVDNEQDKVIWKEEKVDTINKKSLNFSNAKPSDFIDRDVSKKSEILINHKPNKENDIMGTLLQTSNENTTYITPTVTEFNETVNAKIIGINKSKVPLRINGLRSARACMTVPSKHSTSRPSKLNATGDSILNSLPRDNNNQLNSSYYESITSINRKTFSDYVESNSISKNQIKLKNSELNPVDKTSNALAVGSGTRINDSTKHNIYEIDSSGCGSQSFTKGNHGLKLSLNKSDCQQVVEISDSFEAQNESSNSSSKTSIEKLGNISRSGLHRDVSQITHSAPQSQQYTNFGHDKMQGEGKKTYENASADKIVRLSSSCWGETDSSPAVGWESLSCMNSKSTKSANSKISKEYWSNSPQLHALAFTNKESGIERDWVSSSKSCEGKPTSNTSTSSIPLPSQHSEYENSQLQSFTENKDRPGLKSSINKSNIDKTKRNDLKASYNEDVTGQSTSIKNGFSNIVETESKSRWDERKSSVSNREQSISLIQDKANPNNDIFSMLPPPNHHGKEVKSQNSSWGSKSITHENSGWATHSGNGWGSTASKNNSTNHYIPKRNSTNISTNNSSSNNDTKKQFAGNTKIVSGDGWGSVPSVPNTLTKSTYNDGSYVKPKSIASACNDRRVSWEPPPLAKNEDRTEMKSSMNKSNIDKSKRNDLKASYNEDVTGQSTSIKNGFSNIVETESKSRWDERKSSVSNREQSISLIQDKANPNNDIFSMLPPPNHHGKEVKSQNSSWGSKSITHENSGWTTHSGNGWGSTASKNNSTNHYIPKRNSTNISTNNSSSGNVSRQSVSGGGWGSNSSVEPAQANSLCTIQNKESKVDACESNKVVWFGTGLPPKKLNNINHLHNKEDSTSQSDSYNNGASRFEIVSSTSEKEGNKISDSDKREEEMLHKRAKLILNSRLNSKESKSNDKLYLPQLPEGHVIDLIDDDVKEGGIEEENKSNSSSNSSITMDSIVKDRLSQLAHSKLGSHLSRGITNSSLKMKSDELKNESIPEIRSTQILSNSTETRYVAQEKKMTYPDICLPIYCQHKSANFHGADPAILTDFIVQDINSVLSSIVKPHGLVLIARQNHTNGSLWPSQVVPAKDSISKRELMRKNGVIIHPEKVCIVYYFPIWKSQNLCNVSSESWFEYDFVYPSQIYPFCRDYVDLSFLPNNVIEKFNTAWTIVEGLIEWISKVDTVMPHSFQSLTEAGNTVHYDVFDYQFILQINEEEWISSCRNNDPIDVATMIQFHKNKKNVTLNYSTSDTFVAEKITDAHNISDGVSSQDNLLTELDSTYAMLYHGLGTQLLSRCETKDVKYLFQKMVSLPVKKELTDIDQGALLQLVTKMSKKVVQMEKINKRLMAEILETSESSRHK